MVGRAHIVHVAIQGTLTVHAAITFAAHSVSPQLEALAFFIGTVAAVWAVDVERRMRHPKCRFKSREES